MSGKKMIRLLSFKALLRSAWLLALFFLHTHLRVYKMFTENFYQETTKTRDIFL
jgi:hypothetical protein